MTSPIRDPQRNASNPASVQHPLIKTDYNATFASSTEVHTPCLVAPAMKERVVSVCSRVTMDLGSLDSIPSYASGPSTGKIEARDDCGVMELRTPCNDQANWESTLVEATQLPPQQKPSESVQIERYGHEPPTTPYSARYQAEDAFSPQSLESSHSTSRSLDAYTIIGTIGRGSHGKVVLAYLNDDTLSDFTFYAIKVVPGNCSTPEIQNELIALRSISGKCLIGGTSDDSGDMEDDWEETGSRFLQRLSEVFYDQDHCFFVMEYHPATLSNPEISARFYLPTVELNPPYPTSQSLPAYISEDRPNQQSVDVLVASLASLRLLAAELALGLLFLHGKGIVHQDIKPANIMISHEGHAIIGDFGAASQCEEATYSDDQLSIELELPPFLPIVLHAGDCISFTPSYAAPELHERDENGRLVYDTRSDWWSFGMLLHEVSTGSIPFSCEEDNYGPGGMSRKSEGDLSLSFRAFQMIERELSKGENEVIQVAVSNLREFLQRLLVHNPPDRLAGLNVLFQPFFDTLSAFSLWDEVADGKHPPCPNPETTNLVDDRDCSYTLDDESQVSHSLPSEGSVFYTCFDESGENSLLLDQAPSPAPFYPTSSSGDSASDDDHAHAGVPSTRSVSSCPISGDPEDVFIDSGISISRHCPPFDAPHPTIIVSPPPTTKRSLVEENYVLTLPDWITDHSSDGSSWLGSPYPYNATPSLSPFRPETPCEKVPTPCFLGSPFEESTPAGGQRRLRRSSVSDASSSSLLSPLIPNPLRLPSPQLPSALRPVERSQGYTLFGEDDDLPEVLTLGLLEAMDIRDRDIHQSTSQQEERLFKLEEMVRKKQRRKPRKLKKRRTLSMRPRIPIQGHTHKRKTSHLYISAAQRFWGCMRFWEDTF